MLDGATLSSASPEIVANAKESFPQMKNVMNMSSMMIKEQPPDTVGTTVSDV